MVKLIRKIVSSPWVAFHWVNALEDAAKKDFGSSKKRLDAIGKFFEGNNSEYHLLLAYVSYRLGCYDAAVANCLTANCILKGTSRYNDEEKKYLCCYLSLVGNMAISMMVKDDRPEPFDKTHCVGIELRMVRKAIQLNFPIQHNQNILCD